MIQTANVKTGDSVEVYGVFSAWDIPQTLPEITPAKIIHAGGTIIWRRTISSLPSPLSPK
ncbi:lipoprotein [Klebsiella pneumoniae]|nr:lipoprotein [Klebsiella pneumoniae]